MLLQLVFPGLLFELPTFELFLSILAEITKLFNIVSKNPKCHQQLHIVNMIPEGRRVQHILPLFVTHPTCGMQNVYMWNYMNHTHK